LSLNFPEETIEPEEIALPKKEIRNISLPPVVIEEAFQKTVEDTSEKTEEAPAQVEEEVAGKVAIVIDDLGHSLDIAEKLMRLDAPIAFSILPGRRYSKLIASQANKSNHEVMLHLPMEPKNYPGENPGLGALISKMNSDELENQLIKNLDAIPFITGTNNHMGSKLTENDEIMQLVMSKIKKRNLFFLDSRTSPNTVAYKIAREYGIKAAKRNIFLDNEDDLDLISQQIIKLGDAAIKKGSAIGIGHPGKNTLIALQNTLPKLKERGIKIVPISQLVN
jgi:polysaccharide deacetylase 2 family uncharacterized protein YibQ